MRDFIRRTTDMYHGRREVLTLHGEISLLSIRTIYSLFTIINTSTVGSKRELAGSISGETARSVRC